MKDKESKMSDLQHEIKDLLKDKDNTSTVLLAAQHNGRELQQELSQMKEQLEERPVHYVHVH